MDRMKKISIKHWADDDRPREKLLRKGAGALSNSELLAILINNGTPENNAVELAKNLLSAARNDLKTLANMSVRELVKLKIKGLGEAKATTIAAALELGIRRNMAGTERQKVSQSHDIALYLSAQLAHRRREVFAIVLLNKANKIIHFEVISEGGITGTVADPRVILKKALEYDAVAVILCHNHPSGNLKPSKADQLITQQIKTAAAYLQVAVLDHIIVSDEGYFSFADEGIL